ncbi:MAG: hypothetical protein LBH49_03235 [Puniceicoccales bacterium]|nr:hypothetical protein [Puniceicoccales bacterium]
MASTILVILVGLLGNGLDTAINAWRLKSYSDKAHCDILLCLDQIEQALSGSTIATSACDASHMMAIYDSRGTSLSFCRPSIYDSSKMSLTEFKLAQLPLDYYYLMNKTTPLTSVKGIFMLRSELDNHISGVDHVLPSSKANTDRQNNEKEDIYNLILPNVTKFHVSILYSTRYDSTNPKIDYIGTTLAPKHFTIDQMAIFDSHGTEINDIPKNHEQKFIDLMIEVIPNLFVNKYEKASEAMRKKLIQQHGVRMNRIIKLHRPFTASKN